MTQPQNQGIFQRRSTTQRTTKSGQQYKSAEQQTNDSAFQKKADQLISGESVCALEQSFQVKNLFAILIKFLAVAFHLSMFVMLQRVKEHKTQNRVIDVQLSCANFVCSTPCSLPTNLICPKVRHLGSGR